VSGACRRVQSLRLAFDGNFIELVRCGENIQHSTPNVEWLGLGVGTKTERSMLNVECSMFPNFAPWAGFSIAR
jgi:hypothetical protein